MLRQTYSNLLQKAVKMYLNGNGQAMEANPAISFTKMAKNGNFDIISDDRYNQALHDVESLSETIWYGQPNQTWDVILRNVLRMAEPADDLLGRLVGIYTSESSCRFDNERFPYFYDPVSGTLNETAIWEAEPLLKATPEIPFTLEPANKTHSKRREASGLEALCEECSLNTPKEIYAYLNKHVYGQQDAKRAAATLIWSHATKHLRRNAVFVGPTGCGKTKIWRQASKIYDNIRIVDVSHLTGDGWTGSMKVRNLFDGLTPQTAEHTIYVLDEADKLFEPAYGSSGTNYSYVVQNELLKLLDSNDEVVFPADEKSHQPELRLRTKNMSFVLLGSFETMVKCKNADIPSSIGFNADVTAASVYDYTCDFSPQDLIEYAGVRREIAGRINTIVQLQSMTADDYLAILHNPVISPITALSKQYGIKLRLDKKSAQELAQQAADSQMGVRYMTARLTEILDDRLFNNCDATSLRLSM